MRDCDGIELNKAASGAVICHTTYRVASPDALSLLPSVEESCVETLEGLEDIGPIDRIYMFLAWRFEGHAKPTKRAKASQRRHVASEPRLD